MSEKKKKEIIKHNEGSCDKEETRLDTMGKDISLGKDSGEVYNDELDPKNYECKWIKIKIRGDKEIFQYSIVPKTGE